MLRLLAKYLEPEGFEIATAEDGEIALQFMRTTGASLVICDWAMPNMDGIELCRAVRSCESIGFCYFMIVTAHSEKERVVEALEAGANDFISKPFHRQELLARVRAGMRIVGLEANLALQTRRLHKANAEMAILNHKLEMVASHDELTELPNRREGMERLKQHWSTSIRRGESLACLMLDIDHFKRCNDTYGHDAGDEVLRQTARVLANNIRAGDTACRLGGEEFIVILPYSDAEAARELAERVRVAIEQNRILTSDAELQVTMSIGLAQMDESTTAPDDLLKLADRALYLAKRNGRNRVCCPKDLRLADPSSTLEPDAGGDGTIVGASSPVVAAQDVEAPASDIAPTLP